MIKIGLIGTHQLSFFGPKEKEYYKAVSQMKENSRAMKFDFVHYENLVVTEEDAKAAVKFMEEKAIDFLLILNVSYSSGFLVPILYKIQNAYLGIWSIPEGVESGPVPLNSFCSNNMYQAINRKYLKDFNIKCKWFFGYADSEQFKRRLSVTVKALTAIKKLKNSRVALIGGFAPGFNDLYFDERSVNRKLNGIYINRLHEYSEIIKIADSVSEEEIFPYLNKLENTGVQFTPNARKLVPLSYKLYAAYKKFIDKNKYDALAISCWPKFQQDYKYSVCSTMGMLNDDKIIAACEGDLMSAISMIALQEMSGESTTLMDFSAFDESDNSVLMWHCGPSALNFCKNNGYKLGENYSGMPHKPGEIIGCGVARDMEFDEADVTVFRFSGDMERYLNVTGSFMGAKKQSFNGSRGWMDNVKLNNQDISVLDFTNTILSGGFEHHYPIAKGNFSDEIAEMNKWLGIEPVKKIAYADYLQEEE